MIAHSDISTFSNACLKLYQPDGNVENFRARAFAFLAELVGSEMIAWGEFDPKTSELDICFDRTHADLVQAMQAFGALMTKYPLFCWDETVNNGKPFSRSDFFTGRQFRQLDIYHETYRLLNINNHCAVYVPAEDGKIVFAGIERGGITDFSVRDRQLLEMAQPHLANARKLSIAASQVARHSFEPEIFTAAGFTPRQSAVLYWLTEGKSNAEIAQLLHIRLATVKGYLMEIFNRAGVSNRVAATLYALDFARKHAARSAKHPGTIVPVAFH